jgi:hypothetical protein
MLLKYYQKPLQWPLAVTNVHGFIQAILQGG